MKKRLVVALSVVVIVMIAVMFHISFWNTDGVELPWTAVEAISEDDYLTAYRQNEAKPLRHDYHFQVIYPTDAKKFYKVAIKDDGYNKELPIDFAIYFAMDGDGQLLSESYFCIASMPDSPRYSKVFVLLDNTSPEKAKVFLTLMVNTVGFYDRDGVYDSVPYEYQATGWVDCEKSEMVKYTVRQG